MSIILVLLALMFYMGAAVFSFVGVVVYRLPRGMNYISGRSICPGCNNQLKWYHNIPIFSYLFLRGKCGYCKKPIGCSHLVLELVGGALSLFTFCFHTGLYPGAGPESLLNLADKTLWQYLLVFSLLAALTAVLLLDIKTMEIPDGLSIFIALLGLASVFVFPQISLLDRGIGLLSVSLPLFLIALAIDGAFGGGDIKLMAAAGIFLGWKLNLFALFIALILGGARAAYLMVSHKKTGKEHMAFGPYLCIGIALAWFAGDKIIAWYLSFFGLMY